MRGSRNASPRTSPPVAVSFRGMSKVLAGLLMIFCLAASPEFPELRKSPATMRADAPEPKAIEPANVKAWEAQRKELRAAWEQILGPMPARVPLNVEVVSREVLDDHVRLLLRYQNDAKTTNDAFLLIPKDVPAGRKLPGVVVLHPTNTAHYNVSAGLAGKEGSHHALHLVRRGYVCIAPRNYLWAVEGRSWKQSAADVKKQGPYTTGLAKMLFDAIRAVDVLVDRPEVDPTRIGAIGHSLGGKEALYLPAFDERIVASISCEGGIGLGMSNWSDDHYFGEVIAGPDFAHDNQEVLALIAPRAILVIGGQASDGAKSWPYIEAALPVWRLYDAESRIGLLRHNLGHQFPPPGPDRELAYSWFDHWLKQ
jgi:acetyl esterase/lipase